MARRRGFLPVESSIVGTSFRCLVTACALLTLTSCELGADQTSMALTTETAESQPSATKWTSKDLEAVVLRPADVEDLFESTTYSISQELDRPGLTGLQVTYPTRVMEHTTAFAEGFSTTVLVFEEIESAQLHFDKLATNYPGKPLAMEPLADASRAFVGNVMTSEGYELAVNEFLVIFRKDSVVASITLRTSLSVDPSTLQVLGNLVADRLED